MIEAGLGGRYDATNVIPSSVQVLTNVGLEHTRWLGPTIADIAEREAGRRASRGHVGGRRDWKRKRRQKRSSPPLGSALAWCMRPHDPGVALAALGGFQRRNFAVARAAAEAFMGPLDEAAVEAAAASVLVPGRLQPVGEDPLTLLDGAHNPSGLRALAESLPDVVATRTGPLVAVVSILDDKDAAAMLRELLPHVDAVVFTRSVNPRALSPATLESLWRQLGGAQAEIESDPKRAVERARALAGTGGSVLVTGSIYLVADLLREPSARRASMM